MFACVSADDDDSVTGYSHRDKRQVEQEDEIINKVLEEAMRLKKRCKVLTNALSEAENKAIADKKDDEAYLQKEISMELSRVTSTHEFDMAYLRDTKDREINDLYRYTYFDYINSFFSD
jgi:ABC-type phosphate transport system auxiliary subunit